MAEMDAFNRKSLTDDGFVGFVTFDALRSGVIREVPETGGVYVVLREADAPPDFLANNRGGRFKKRNPTVPVADLEAKWVDRCHVIYVGKGENLRRRVKEYMDFGSGKPVGHWGGRYIWQLVDAATLLLAWRTAAPDQTAGSAEAALIAEFKQQHGDRLPFANIADVTASRVDSPPALASTSMTGRKVMPASFANSQRGHSHRHRRRPHPAPSAGKALPPQGTLRGQGRAAGSPVRGTIRPENWSGQGTFCGLAGGQGQPRTTRATRRNPVSLAKQGDRSPRLASAGREIDTEFLGDPLYLFFVERSFEERHQILLPRLAKR
jgi:hypothetical protein